MTLTVIHVRVRCVGSRGGAQGASQAPPASQGQRYFQPLTIDTVNVPGQSSAGAGSQGTPLLQADRNTSQSPGARELALYSFTLKAYACQHFAICAVQCMKL